MKLAYRSTCRAGLSLVEVLVVLGVFAVLVVLLLPGFGPNRKASSKRIACVDNLKKVGLAFRNSVGDDGRFPWAVPERWGGSSAEVRDAALMWKQFAAVSNQLAEPKWLHCPADKTRQAAATWATGSFSSSTKVFQGNHQLSYFVGMSATEENPNSILSGDRNITNAAASPPQFWRHKGVVKLAHQQMKDIGPSSGIGYDHQLHNLVGAILMGDGSVQQVTSGRLREALRDFSRSTGNADLEFVFPYGED